MKKRMPKHIFPLISLETGEIIIEDTRDGMTVTPVQAEIIQRLDILVDCIDELPLVEREVLMRKHCIGAYTYGINTFKEIAKEMNSTVYHIKKAYERATMMLKHLILK